MSFRLSLGTKPTDLEVETIGGFGLERTVFLGDYEISLEDFLCMAVYVLTNTDLIGPDDPRLQFVKCVKSMHKVPGYGPGNNKRLNHSIPLVILRH